MPTAPIHEAALRGHLEEVRRLIQQDPQLVHCRADAGDTPLHYACGGGDVEVVAWLLGHEAHINQTTNCGETALSQACGQGHLAVVELLLREGADPTIPMTNGWTPLMVASMEYQVGVDVVRCLLQHPQALATLNHHDEDGRTALYWACRREEDDGVVSELLEAGADPTIATHGGETLLMMATAWAHVDVMRCLLRRPQALATVNHRDEYDLTALYLACRREDGGDVVMVLLEAGADPTIATDKGETPLMMASLEAPLEVVRSLLCHPQALATLHHRDDEGCTALYYACFRRGHIDDVVRLLLEAGADPLVTNNHGSTPIGVARRRGKEVCVELLEEWERHYLLTKARHLRDAGRDRDVSQALAQQSSSSSSSTSPSPTAKRPCIKVVPTYLRCREEKGEPLPTVKVLPLAALVDGERPVKEIFEGYLVGVVFEHVVCGGLPGELFEELMEEVLGRTGCRKDRTKKEVEGPGSM